MIGLLAASILTAPPETVAAVSIVDLTGAPIPGATIRMRTIKNFVVGEYDVSKGGFHIVPLDRSTTKTNAEGRWASPPLQGGCGYVVEANAPGFVGDFSRWIHPDEKGRVELPPIKLRRLVSVPGNVRDRSGRPLAEVRVFTIGDGPALRECRSKADGLFELRDVPEGRLIVFGEKTDHYLTATLTDGKSPISLTLAPRNAPNPERMPPRAPALPSPIDPAVRAQARTAAIEQADAVFAQKKDDRKARTANLGAFHAPDHLLRLARSANYERAFTRDQCLYMIAVSLDRKAIWEPEIIASEIGKDYRHSVFSSLAYNEKDSAKRYDLFARMALEARDQDDDSSRMYSLANLAESMAEQGFVKEAAPLAQEAQEIAEQLPKTATNESIWLSVAMGWSLVDAEKVRALRPKIKGFRERLACNVARINPSLAKEIFADFEKSLKRPSAGHWISELAYHIAKTDLPTAERYADNVFSRTDRFESVGSNAFPDPPKLFGLKLDWPRPNVGPALWRGVLQGFLADARMQVGDEVGARRLLADAVQRIESVEGEAWHTAGFFWTKSACLAAIVPLAERIDETLVPELVWKTLASRAPREEIDSHNLEGRTMMTNGVACVLARYRPDLARHLIESNADVQWRQSWRGAASMWIGDAYFDVDPAVARRWCDSVCDLPNPFSNEKPSKSPRQTIQTFLWVRLDPAKVGRPTLKRWRTLLSMLWLERVVDKNIDRED